MPRKPTALDDLKRRQREDIEAQFESDWAGKLVPHGRLTRAIRWLSIRVHRWTERLNRLTKWVKAVAIFLGAAGTVWQAVRSWWGRDVPPPELPANGTASTALDRVDPPRASDESDHGTHK